MRQRNDKAFAECLKHLAEDCMNGNDIAMLKSREIKDRSLLPEDHVQLFATNEEVTSYNDAILSSRSPLNHLRSI